MTYPHCDDAVLHAPGECVYCDRYPEAQARREANGINFTGQHDPSREPCPAEARRGLGAINRWSGNWPTTQQDIDERREAARAFWAEQRESGLI